MVGAADTPLTGYKRHGAIENITRTMFHIPTGLSNPDNCTAIKLHWLRLFVLLDQM
jgi:hypothetical protein